MTLTEFTEGTCTNQAATRDSFHLAIIYDTSTNGDSAMQVCQQLIDTFGAELLFHIAVCDLDFFDGRHDGTPAMKSAQNAALVLVAANELLPASVRDWLEHWAAYQCASPLAIALMPDSERSTREFLQRLCARHGIDFIVAGEQADVSHSVLAGFAFANEP